MRDGQRVTLTMTPIYDPGAKRTLGSASPTAGPRENLLAGEAARHRSVDEFWFITKQTVALPAKLFNAEKRKQINGIVGVYETPARRSSADARDAIVLILALISLSLAIVNLFPFLPLDGGHIFWAVVEKVRRRPVPFAVMESAGVVGFMLVIRLFLIGLTNDIGRLTGGGFQVAVGSALA